MFGHKAHTHSQPQVEKPTAGYDSFDARLGDEMRGERATIGKSLLDVQRELRIKASYISAIENTDLAAFDSLSFVAGYVRSYARYLGLDPEVTFARFCEESGFGGSVTLKPMETETPRRMALHELPLPGWKPAESASAKATPAAADPLLGTANPFAKKTRPVFAGFEPGALGSLAVLAILVGGLGYGGWTVIEEIQRVHVAPVEQEPTLVVDVDPLAPSDTLDNAAAGDDGMEASTHDRLAELYRPKPLDAPVLVARDSPISTIPPGTNGAFAALRPAEPDAAVIPPRPDLMTASVDAALLEALGEATPAEAPAPPRVLAEAPETVVLVAARAAWVRVRSAEGATLFEKVLEPGETYEVPVAEAPATLRTGNSGAVYMSVAGETYGPVAPGIKVVSNVTLTADAVRETYKVADLEDDGDLARVVAELDVPTELPGGSDPVD
ncbi:helix-turn-helix domain-containing protein [uncultured Jannaschia sp.]|uniref:helix-turn-helix domain-containing protein n=1 Tax=uncultured Jannaschia sp. TaxID=293347 RepID=UPI00261DCFAF|nr:helix-turn-helix domain-containing protein [uncultured Jannaschia sp.]